MAINQVANLPTRVTNSPILAANSPTPNSSPIYILQPALKTGDGGELDNDDSTHLHARPRRAWPTPHGRPARTRCYRSACATSRTSRCSLHLSAGLAYATIVRRSAASSPN